MPTVSSQNYTGLYGAGGTVTPGTAYGNANVVGLLSAGSDGANTVSNIVATGNVTASFFIGDGSQLTNLPTGSDYSNANVAAFLPTYTGNISANTISATGNIITDGFFVGNFAGNISGNLTVPGLNTQVLFNNSGNAGASSDFTFNDSTNVMSVNGNIVATNIAGSGTGLSNITGANVTGVVAEATLAGTANIAAVANSVAGANVSGAVAEATQAATANVANSVAGANVSGVVAEATQAATANVANSVAGANVSGVVAQATQAATANVALVANSVAGANVSGAVAQATQAATANVALVANSVAGANVTGAVAQATQANTANTAITAGTVTSNAQANITSVGTLTSLSASGNITTSGNISGNFILGNGSQLTGIAASYGNTEVAAFLPTYTGAMPAMTGNVTTTANVQGAYLIGDGSQITNLPAGTYGNANVANFLANFGSNTVVTTGNITGGNLLLGGAQYVSGSILGAPGSYAGLFGRYLGNSATGSYVAAGISAANQVDINANGQEWTFGATGNITLPSNTAAINYANGVNILSGVTTTYGNANVVSLLAAFGSNTINTTGNASFGNMAGFLSTGNQPNITNVGTLGSLNVTAGIIALGNIQGGNLSTSGVLSASGNVNASQNIVATGNITGGNLITGGSLTATGLITATGNVRSQANVVAAGNVVAQGFFIGDGSQLTNVPGSGYGNANVAAYLPTHTGNVGAGNVNLVGTENTVLGQGAGLNGATGSSTTDRLTAIGYQAGNIGNASQRSTLVGWRAGYSNGGTDTVAIGRSAGNSSQGTYAVSVGSIAGATNQGLEAIAIGYNAAAANQGASAIAIGADSGNNQGNSSIVIGSGAGNAAVANSIVITTQNITSTGPGLFVDPVRSDTGNVVNAMRYNTTTKEITYANAAAGANTQIQFNSNGALSGNSAFTWNSANAQALIGNILITQANNNLRNVNAWDANTSPQQARITMGTGYDGDFSVTRDPLNATRGAQLAIINKQTIGNADVMQNARSLAVQFIADLDGATLTNGGRRLQGGSIALAVGNGTQTVSVGPVFATAAGGGQNLQVGNVTLGASSIFPEGSTSLSHGCGALNTVLVGGNATIGNAIATVNTLQYFTNNTGNVRTGIGTSTNFAAGLAGQPTPGNVYGYYMPGVNNNHGITNTNQWRAADNYYFLMNEDDAAQVRLGSLRRYHEFQFALATSGAVGIDKNNAQVQYLAPTANVDITGYSNFVTTASDGTNNDPQADTVTIIVQQGATPFTVTLPTGNAQIKYANAVSTVGSTANAVTTIQVQAIRDIAANAVVYLTTVSPEFV